MDARKKIEWLVKNCAEPFKDGLNKGMNDAGRWGAQLIHRGFLSDTPVDWMREVLRDQNRHIRKDLEARTFVGWLKNCAWARSVVIRSEKTKSLWCWSNMRYDWVCRFCGEPMPDNEMNEDDPYFDNTPKPTECPSCGAKVGEWRI